MIRTAVLGLARIGRNRELEHLVAAARQRRAADVQSLDVTVGL